MSSSYKHTMKATVVLSGAQLVETLMSLVRAKVIAFLLGPLGIALNSVFLITLNTLYQFVSLGLPQSAVRDISRTHSSNDAQALRRTVSVFITFMRLLAVVAFLICIFAAPLLNDLSFGKGSTHTLDFLILSVAAAAMLLSYANITLLQGMQRLHALAKTTMLAAVFGVVAGVPLFYWMGYKGISIAISAGYIATFCINSFFVRKLQLARIQLPWRELWRSGKPMIKLGVVIMLSSLIVNLFTYFTNIFIRHLGSIEDVGLFQAAYSITNRNFAILSAALVADFYPRLSRLLDNRQAFNRCVSEQGELLLILISVVSALLIVFAKPIIWLLLSKEFYSVEPLTQLIAYSFVFRIMWLTLSYIPLAKGDKRVYLFCDAIVGNGGNFAIGMAFYARWGLTGIGFATVAGTIFVSLLLFFAYRHFYHFAYSRAYWRLQGIYIVFLTLFLLLQIIEQPALRIASTAVLGVPFGLFSYRALNRRLHIKEYIQNKFTK